MKRPGNLVFSILSAVLLTACTSYIEEAGMPVQEPVSKLLRISSTDTVLTSADASIVALMERHGAASTKSSNIDEIDDIVPIYGDEGDVLMYAVNFRTGGYTIVSATKDYYPVLAKIEKGRYSDELYKTGASVLMQEYREGMKYAKTLPRDSILSLRALWMKYEEPHTGQWVATKSNDQLASLVGESIQEWQEQGLSYTFLSEGPPKEMPYDVYQRYVAYAEGLSNPDYDYYENCVIIGESIGASSSQSPLITTSWHQQYPFNYNLPAGWNIGCCAIATSQIMAYYKYPSNLNWSGILALNPEVIGNFVYDVALGINTNFGIQSGSTIDDVQNYLIETGYNVQKISHATTDVMESLDAKRPVYMRGTLKNQNYGHAWICDGYMYSNDYIKYTLLILSLTEPLKYEPCGEPYLYEPPRYMDFHMNWGWGGTGNGYYADNEWFDVNIFSGNRMDLIHVYPK